MPSEIAELFMGVLTVAMIMVVPAFTAWLITGTIAQTKGQVWSRIPKKLKPPPESTFENYQIGGWMQ